MGRSLHELVAAGLIALGRVEGHTCPGTPPASPGGDPPAEGGAGNGD